MQVFLAVAEWTGSGRKTPQTLMIEAGNFPKALSEALAWVDMLDGWELRSIEILERNAP